MSRRHAKAETAFGSDSFLDVIANIVGILIILIVVAGVRVSRIPVAEAGSATAVEQRPPMLLPPVPQAEMKPETAPIAALEVPPPEPAPPPAPPAELVEEARRLKEQLAAFDQEARSVTGALRLGRGRVAAVQDQLASVQKQLSLAQDTLRLQSNESAQSQAGFEQMQGELATLQQELLEAERERPAAQQIGHRLTPVSRVVEGPELHFRLAQEQVAFVPVEDLIERLRRDVERNKDWIVRTQRYKGEVGPVRGFVMTYIVQRRPFSILEELRSGRGIVQIGISAWKIEPAANLVAETAEQALRPGSRFYQALLSAPRDATLTFWVYPDSFGLYRQLQAFAHREGFTIAARPLPFGIPIAGSPNGSRSAGQ